MVTGRRTWPTAGLGVAAVVVGLVVLSSPGAQAEVGWFSYTGPPSAEVLDALVAWNLVRAVGAVLVLVGLLVLAQLLGVSAARRSGGTAAPLAGRVLLLGVVLVVGGLVAFVVLGVVDRETVVRQIGVASSVWTRDQLAAALVVATGLVVGAVSLGLRTRDAP